MDAGNERFPVVVGVRNHLGSLPGTDAAGYDHDSDILPIVAALNISRDTRRPFGQDGFGNRQHDPGRCWDANQIALLSQIP